MEISDTTYSEGVAYEVLDDCRIDRPKAGWALHLCPTHPVSLYIVWGKGKLPLSYWRNNA